MTKKSRIDKEVIDSTRTKLDNAANTRYVKTESPAKTSGNVFTIVKWTLTLVIMMMSIFAYWSLQKPGNIAPQVKFYSIENLVNHEVQVWQEDVALLDDIDFYTWLATEDIYEDSHEDGHEDGYENNSSKNLSDRGRQR